MPKNLSLLLLVAATATVASLAACAPDDGADALPVTADEAELTLGGFPTNLPDPLLPCLTIDQKAAELGSTLGTPTTAELSAADGGTYRHYTNGSLFRVTCALAILAPLRDEYVNKLGGPQGFLGYPNADSRVRSDGTTYAGFKNGGIMLHTPATGAHEMHGSIRAKWTQMGAFTSVLGALKTNELTTPEGRGRYNDLTVGSLYWSPATGAFSVQGSIRGKYLSMSGTAGFLGFPLTDELATPAAGGRYNDFEGGSIYWSPGTGAFSIQGGIREKWLSLGGTTSSLGFPVSDEAWSSDGTARLSRFQNGTICWTSAKGSEVAPPGASCNAPPPACTKTTYTFCCHGSPLNSTVTGQGCNKTEAQKDAYDHMFGWCPLSDGACTAACDSLQTFCFSCPSTGGEYYSQACTRDMARANLASGVSCPGGFYDSSCG